MGKYTAEDIINAYRRNKNSGRPMAQSSSASKRKVTGQDIINSYQMHESSRQNTSSVQSTSNSSVQPRTSNVTYANDRLSGLTDQQKDAISQYNNYMNMYRSASMMFNSDSLVGTDNSASYYNTAMNYKKNSGLDSDTFDNYAKNWDTYEDVQKVEAYRQKTSSVLDNLNEEQKQALSSYNDSISQYKNSVLSAMGMAGTTADMTLYDNAMQTKNEYIKKYGVSSEDFDKYAQYVKENADKEATDKMIADIKASINEDPAKYGALLSVADVVSAPLSGFLAAGETIASLGYADKDAPINTNSYLYALQNMGTATEQAVADEIDNPVGDFLYGAGVGTLKSAVTLPLGPLALPAFGASAYSSALKTAQDKGISKERAMMTALPAAAAEIVFEKLSLDHLLDIYKTVGKTALKDTIWKVVIQSGIEGSEEVFTELTNIITDGVINGDFSDYEMNVRNYQANNMTEEEARTQATIDAAWQVGEAFFAGTLSGGILGGGTTAVSKLNYNNLGKAVNQDAETKAKVIESAQTMDGKTTAKDIVSNTKAEDITDAQMAEVLESMMEVDESMVSEILSEIAPVQSTVPSNTNQMNNNTLSVGNLSAKDGGTLNTTSYAQQNHGVTQARLASTNEPVVAVKFDTVSKNNATVRLSNDTVVPLEEVQMNDRTMQNLYNFAAVMDTTEAANAMLDNYKGQPLEVYEQACAVFYNAGQLKSASFDEMLQNSKNANLIAGMGDPATLYLMFSLGRNSVEKIAPVQSNTKAKKTKSEGKVIDNRTDKHDTKIVKIAEMVAKRTGLEITLNDSLEQGENGHFSAALGRIALSSQSHNKYETLVHELLEYASTYNPEKMQEVYDMVLRYAMSDMGAKNLTSAIKQYQDTYSSVEKGKTFQSASEEFVHDYLAGTFSSEEGIRDFVEFMSMENVSVEQQSSILQTVADFFNDMVKKIREYVEEHTMSDAAKMALRADEQQAKKMRQMVLEVLEDTIGSETESQTTEVRQSLNVNFANEVGAWYNDKEAYKKTGGFFRVGRTSEALKSIGVKEQDITWDKSKIKAILKDHPEMDIDVIKEVPGVIENPIVVMQSKTRLNSITVLGEVKAKNEQPVMVAMHLQPEGKSGRIMNMIKISNSFARNNTQGLINTSDILYVEPNKNRTDNWLSAFGLQLPVGLTNYGSIDKVTYYDETVNKSEKDNSGKTAFSAALEKAGVKTTETSTKKSLKVELSEDNLGRKLSEAQIEYFKDSKVRDENGALKPVYHGTKADFSVFDVSKNKVITFGNGFYFGENKDTVSSYYAGDNGKVMETYVNISNPFIIEQSQLKDIDSVPHVIEEILGVDGVTKENIKETLESYGYDGIHYKNSQKGNDVYVAYDSKQIKDVDNTNPTTNPDIKLSLNVKLDEEIESYDIETKFNDYIGLQKKVISTLRAENFFDNNIVTNEETGMKIVITAKGIKETLGSGNRFQTLPRELKRLKVATIRSLPEIIEKAKLLKDNVENTHGNDPQYAYFITDTIIEGEEAKIKIDVKKSLDSNKFWIHNIQIKKNSESLSPATTQVLNEPQSSSKERITQNSENATKKSLDIKLSLDVDLMSILEEEYSQEENDSASIIEEGFASLQNVTVNKKVMHKLAYNLKKEYKSAYNIDDLTENLTNVFAYLKDHPDAKYEDMVRIMKEVAKPVIEESTDVDTWEKAMYDNFRSYFKGKTIRLNKEQRDEVAHYYGSFENFRRKNFGSIQFSATDGTYLDSLWEEIVQQSSYMLESDTSYADQPIALMDAMAALKPVKKNIYGMNTEQASYDLALDIFRQFFAEQAQEKANEKVIKTALRLTERKQEYCKQVRKEFNEAVGRLREYDKEKRENMRREYEIKLNDAKKSMYAAVKDHDSDSARKYSDMEKFYQEQLRLLNQEANEKVLAIKAANRQNMANRRAYEEQKRVRERITRNAKGIINYFNTNTDKRHIPEALKTPIAQFITSIDFVSEKANPNSAATLAWQDSLNLMYRRLSDEVQEVEKGDDVIEIALNNYLRDVLKDMNNFLEQCDGKRVTDLSVRELEWLDGIITGLRRAITDINRLYVNKRSQSVSELAMESIHELQAKKDKKSHSFLVEKGLNVMDANMLDARSYFDRLGEAAFSIYDELRTAFNERVWMLKEAQDYMTKALEGLDVKSWTGENAKVHDFVINGQHLQMTTSQIMSLYELNKRNQAKLHMTIGGIRPTVIGKGAKQIKRVTPVKLTSRDIDIICDALTPEQKAVADKIQKFLGTNCAKWGNKASMQMYGYERFGAKNYFPIKVNGNSVDTKDDSKFWFTKNQGFTKTTTENAANALIVSDIFEVFTNHVTDMASYSSYSAALMDAMKWFNFRSTEMQENENINNELKTEIERVYGDTYITYFKKLIEDINAETKHGIESELAELLTSNMKAASVGANLRVAIQQPTAYLRASAVMDLKYLTKAVFKKSAMKKAKEHSAITLWKSWGYFETSIGRSMQNVLTNQTTLKERVVDKSMAVAQFMDDFTWGYLWNACELEISDKYKDVKYDSPEYLELVSKRFDEVVDQTQVVDTVLHKSHIMRSKNIFNKMVTSFMSEPTKSYNLLMNRARDVYEGKKGAKKVLVRAVNAYVVTQILNAAVVSIVDAYRDWEEEDKTFVEKYLENFKENVVDNMNPLSMIPYAKDIVSIFEGYDVSRQDMQGLSTFIQGGKKIAKYINDEEYRSKHTFWEVCKDMIKGGSQVIGVPGYNPLRDIEAFWNTTFPDMRIGGRIYTNKENYNNMLDALLNNDTEAYESAYQDLISKGVAEDDIPGKMISKIKERCEAGSISEDKAISLLMKEYGYSSDEAWFKVSREWKYDSKYGLLYKNIDGAFESGKTSDRAAIQSEINELINHGVDKSDVAGVITRNYKEQYLELLSKNKASGMKNLLITCYMYCGYTREESMKKIEKWSE